MLDKAAPRISDEEIEAALRTQGEGVAAELLYLRRTDRVRYASVGAAIIAGGKPSAHALACPRRGHWYWLLAKALNLPGAANARKTADGILGFLARHSRSWEWRQDQKKGRASIPENDLVRLLAFDILTSGEKPLRLTALRQIFGTAAKSWPILGLDTGHAPKRQC
jgi:hypothetical protein